MAEVDFEEFTRPLIGMELTHIWRGYGSAMFFNFGELHHKTWKNGRISNNPRGQMSLDVTWSWRVEGRRRILWGSWSEDYRWERLFQKLIGARVAGVSLVGRLPEIDLELSCGVHVVSFMTATSDPEWALFDNSELQARWLHVRAGRLCEGSSPADVRVKVSDVCIMPPWPRESSVAE